MAAFDYVALDRDGRRHKGVIEADSLRQSRQMLRERALTPVKLSEAAPTRGGKGRGRIGLREVAVMTRQLATLVQASLPVEQALAALSRQADKPKLKSLLAAVRAQVLEGKTLAQGLGIYPRVFSELYRSSVHAGERSGHLGRVLEHLADFTENAYQARQKVLLALLYPAILTVVSILIILFLLTSIIPDMVKVFTGAGQELPGLTRALIGLSHGLQDYGLWLLLLFAAAGYAGKKALERPEVQAKLDERMLRWPVVGRFLLQYNAARFAATLGMLQESGVPLVQALDIAGAVVPNRFLRAQISGVNKQVREGVSLSRAMELSEIFPPVLMTMAASGEASGQLGPMLTRAGGIQQRDMENRIAVLLGLFEPMVLLVMGGLVLILVLAIILPILNLNQLVQ